MFFHLFEARYVTLWWKPTVKPTITFIIDSLGYPSPSLHPSIQGHGLKCSFPRLKTSPFVIRHICTGFASFANFITLPLIFPSVSAARRGSGGYAGPSEETGYIGVNLCRCSQSTGMRNEIATPSQRRPHVFTGARAIYSPLVIAWFLPPVEVIWNHDHRWLSPPPTHFWLGERHSVSSPDLLAYHSSPPLS